MKRCGAEFRYRVRMGCLREKSKEVISVYFVDFYSNVLATSFLRNCSCQFFCNVMLNIRPWTPNVQPV